MIFAAFGTSLPFPRLLAKLDELAKESHERIVVQTGTTPQTAKYCEMFDYAPSLNNYFQDADFVIAHAGLGVSRELLKLNKKFIIIPRHACYNEHNDDHQTETCEILYKKYGIVYFDDINDLTLEVLKNPPGPYPFSDESLKMFQENIMKVLL
ncbi:MAG: glycosyl transferase family 28 [Lentisphaerae bacterium]|nr:glycosyl transferase family 28 [Lentisphaerota bacterium]